MRFLSILVLLSIAVAGCSTTASNDPVNEPGFNSQHFDWTWQPNMAGALGDEVTTGAFPLTWSWQEWLTGEMPPMWSGPEATSSYVITSANVTLTFVPDNPIPSTMNRPQFTMWFGAENSIIEHGFQEGPDFWSAPETVTFPVDSLPMGGLVLFPGEQVQLRVGAYYPDSELIANAKLDLANSNVELSGYTIPTPEVSVADIQMDLLSLTGGRCVADLNPTGAAMGSIFFTVHPNATVLTFHAEVVTGVGLGSDIDFFVLDANGTRISYASGPSSPETLHIRGPNLMDATPGVWTATVYNCQPQMNTVAVTLFQFTD